jgi:hypothetical protein
MEFNVFYLYNADPTKIQPFELLSFRDRPEKYLVYQAFQMPNPAPAFAIVTKVYCRLDPQVPLSPLPLNRSGLRSTAPGAEFQPVALPHAGWSVAAATPPVSASGVSPVRFWPADAAVYTGGGAMGTPSDIPTFQPGSPGVFLSRLLAFEVSQPPMIDELNYLDLPEGMAIYLGASGFGDIDGFMFNTVLYPNFEPYQQFAFRGDLGAVMAAEMAADPAVVTQINAEVQDPNFLFVRNATSPIRAEYFPRIEFEAGGRISRAFAMSPRFTAAGSYVAGSNSRIARQGPINPLFPLFLLVGEDNVQQRQAQVVLPSDFWIMLSSQTSMPKIVKAQVGVPLDQAHVAIAGSVSEH